jgi:Zn-dependent oligopeptidase
MCATLLQGLSVYPILTVEIAYIYRRTFRRYYDNAYIEKTLDLDDNFIKEYFPVDVVVPAILEIYQELLGVKFRDVTGKTSTWHSGDFAFCIARSALHRSDWVYFRCVSA